MALFRPEIIAVGPKTAAAVAEAGLKCREIAREYAAEGIIALFAGRRLDGCRVLLPRALKAREILPETLRKQGAVVDVAAVYETIFPPESAIALAELLATGSIDIITPDQRLDRA